MNNTPHTKLSKDVVIHQRQDILTRSLFAIQRLKRLQNNMYRRLPEWCLYSSVFIVNDFNIQLTSENSVIVLNLDCNYNDFKLQLLSKLLTEITIIKQDGFKCDSFKLEAIKSILKMEIWEFLNDVINEADKSKYNKPTKIK